MLIFLRALAVTAVVFFSLAAHAQTPSCDRPQIFFVNGVWNNTPLDARKSAAELQGAIQQQGVDSTQYGLATGGTTAIRPFWNPGDTGDDGVVEAGQIGQVKAGIRDVLEVFLNQRTAGRALADALGDTNLVWVKRLAAYLGLKKPGVAFQGYIDELKAQLASEIAKGRPIVVVAHSQGNILANRAVTALLAENPNARGIVSVVGVGVADDGGAGDGYRYVTASNDAVIGALPGALKANFAVSTKGNDLFGHEFVETYLSDAVRGSYTGDAGVTSGFSLRATVAQLTKNALARVGCVETTTQLANSLPMQPTIGSPFTFSVKIIPAKAVAEKPLLGRVRIFSGGGELCNAFVAPNGLASCLVTFSGAARSESIRVSFEGRGGYIDSQATVLANLLNTKPELSANFLIEPAGTINPNNVARYDRIRQATIIRFADFNNVGPGTRLSLQISGNYVPFFGAGQDDYDAATAVFWGPRGYVAAAGVTEYNTFCCLWSNYALNYQSGDTMFDFLIPRGQTLLVTIPDGAEYILFGTPSIYFSNNQQGSPPFSVTVQRVP